MAYYSLIGLLFLTVILIFSIRFFILWKKSIPMSFFAEALRNENDGLYEEAATAYERALVKFRPIRFHRHLRNKITEKVRVLRTIIEYNNRFHPGR